MGYLETLMANNERVVFVTRRHWVTVVFAIILRVLLALAIAAGAVFLKIETEDWRALFVLVLLLIPILSIFLRLLRWTNEMYVVTNRRVMEIRGIFAKYAADSALEKVNDVVLYQSLSGRMYDYGDVEIVTGSDIGVNRFRGISRPVRFKTEMLNQKGHLSVYGEDGVGKGLNDGLSRADIPRLLEELDRLHKSGVLSEKEYRTEKRELLDKL